MDRLDSLRSEQLSTARKVRWAAIGLFVLTIYGSLIPFDYEYRPLSETWASFRQMTLSSPSILEARGDWIISVVQFLFLSFFAIASIAIDRPVWVGRAASIVAMPMVVAFAGCIEFLQLCFPPRTVSINDILCAGIGAFLGSIAWLTGGRKIIQWCRSLGRVSTLDALSRRLLPAYVVALLIVQLMPFDFVVSSAELSIKYQEGKIYLIPLESWGKPDALLKVVLNIACFFPLGFLLNFRSARSSAGMTRIPSLALVGPVVVECLQLFVYSRTFDVTDVLTGLIGALVGAWSAVKTLNYIRRPHALPVGLEPANPVMTIITPALVLAWACLVIYFNWRPFNFGLDLSGLRELHLDDDHPLPRFTWLPFVDYYWGSKYNALDQFVRKGISFVPLGAVFALTDRNLFNSRGIWKVVGTAILAGIVVEIGRYYLPARTASVTDVVIECMGAAFGYWFFKFVRATTWAEVALYGWMDRGGHPAHKVPIIRSID